MIPTLPFLHEEVANKVCSEHQQAKEITFTINDEDHVILQGKCLSHQNNYVVYNGFNRKTGELLLVKEWVVHNVDILLKEKIDEQLNLLIQLRHRNLAQLKSFFSEYAAGEQKCTFYILQEFVFGVSLSMFLSKKFPVQIDMLRYIARGVLNVVHFLNENGVTHFNLTHSSVYLDNDGELKLIDYEINEHFPTSVLTQMESNYCDSIYQFGILLLSLIQGKDIEDDDIRISDAFPSALHDFLVKCTTRYNQERSIMVELLNHSFMQISCDQLACIESSQVKDTMHKPELERSKSRAENEFEKLDKLGKGGFGEVFKVRNKIDGKLYALKRIKLDGEDDIPIRKLLREVECLASLNHENIVRYFCSWTDTEHVLDDEEEDESSDKDKIKMKKLLDRVLGMSVEWSNGELECFSETGDTIYEDDESETDSDLVSSITVADSLPLKENIREILYIQMELCEGKTLRAVIDEGYLYQDIGRIWKFLREIVEGLVHIHQKHIIHRDLKPMNIFLDSNDHVKIGDFGLATTNVRYRRETFFMEPQGVELGVTGNKVESGSSTSQAGTSLYKAPELATARTCDNKLDMYSLERPTSQELLKSKRIPPIVEEENQKEMFSFVTNNRHLKLFKYLMECCFHQTNTSVQNSWINIGYRNISKLQSIEETITRIFRIHGGQNFKMSSLMPENSCYDGCTSCLKFLTRSGSIVAIPCNSRVPFVRYITRNKNVSWLRRYAVEKVPKTRGGQREVRECVFDIITPINLRKSNNFLPDAEILHIINEIKNSFTALQGDSFCINLNHSLLTKAILIECGFHEQHYHIVYKLSQLIKDFPDKHDLIKCLNGTKIARVISYLYTVDHFISFETNFTNPKAKDMAQHALRELKCIIDTSKSLGVMHRIKITPSLIHNIDQYSGMLVELVYLSKTKQYVLAAGGRYDAIIKKLQNSTLSESSQHKFSYGVGISVYLENVCELLETEKCLRSSRVVVCSYSHKAVISKETVILRKLWSAGICCSFIKAKSEKHLKKFCRTNNIPYAITLTAKDIDKGVFTITQWKNNTWNVKMPVTLYEVVPILKSLIKQDQEVPIVVGPKINFTTNNCMSVGRYGHTFNY